MDILTLGKIKKLKDALIASDLSTIQQIAVVNQALTQAIDVDVANALQQVSDDLALTQAAVGGDLTVILSSMDTLESDTNAAIAGIPATVANELSALGTAGYLNVGTGANNIVQLDSSGNLPSIGAQNLTGLSQVDMKPWRIQSFSGMWIETMTQGQNAGYGNNGGTYTWSKGSGTTVIKVQVVGGGGGASGYQETGGAGGYAEGWFDATSMGNQSVTVGNGGGGTGYSGCGGRGGSSSFGGYVSANGGYAANCNGQHTGGQPGHGTGGNLRMFGGGGIGHDGGNPSSGIGGSSHFGSAYGTGHGRVSGGWHHAAPGAGGSQYTYGNGYQGTTGAVIVYEYK
jgi:hypothetical protein